MAGGCVWQRGACMAWRCAWQGGMHDKGGVHGRGACVVGGMHGRYYEIRSMSGRYASYWNAFLLIIFLHNAAAFTVNYSRKYFGHKTWAIFQKI